MKTLVIEIPLPPVECDIQVELNCSQIGYYVLIIYSVCELDQGTQT